MVAEDNQPDSEQQGVDPKAFQRVKGEREKFAEELKSKEQELAEVSAKVQGAVLVDGLYEYLRGVDVENLPETLQPGWKQRDFYQLAKQVAPQVAGQDEPGEAAVKWLSDMASLLQPSTPKSAESPMTQANPAGEGIVVESGPFKVGGKEYQEFVKQHGDRAGRQAIVDGQFYFSQENLDAQETAYSL